MRSCRTPAPPRSAGAAVNRPAPPPPVGRRDAVGAGGLRRGTRVRHATLGQGVVMDVEGDGPTGRITVYFEKFGKRKLVSQFAKLEPT